MTQAKSPTEVYPTSKAGGLDVDDAIDSYRRHARAAGLRDQTVDRVYVPRLRQFAAYLRRRGMPTDVAAIKREHVESYILYLKEEAPGRQGRVGQKAASVSISYRTLRTFWRWLIAEDEIATSPMANMRPPAVDEEAPPVLAADEWDRLLKAASGPTFWARRDLALIRLLGDTGMRRGEAAGLYLDDVDFDHNVVHIRPEISKSRRARVVPFSRATEKALDRYFRVRRQRQDAESPWLWLGKRGRLTDSGILQIVQQRGEQAGMKGLHPHVLRHQFAHQMLASGMQEGDVALLGGWRDRGMLSRYGRSAAAERALEAYRRLDRDGQLR
ncbi:MAG: tyrosine-type recombinase/integrase [Chloroflexota bacterium]